MDTSDGKNIPDANFYTGISSAILKTNIKTQNTQRASGGKLHVYTSGLTVPFLVSGGSAEGWCTATRRESNKYQVSSLKYSIAYNWPSDGISLWYDFVNSDPAFQINRCIWNLDNQGWNRRFCFRINSKCIS